MDNVLYNILKRIYRIMKDIKNKIYKTYIYFIFKNKNLHICPNEPKFILMYMDFIKNNFRCKDHFFIIFGNFFIDKKKYKNFCYWDNLEKNLLYKLIKKSNKIILHGLWEETVLNYITKNKELFDKTYCVLWGGDFYFPEKQPDWRIEFIKNIKNVITFIDKDVEYLNDKYGVYPKYYKCIMYLNGIFDENLYKDCEKIKNDEIWIQVGNSATDTNNHELIFEKLVKFKDQKIKIIVPLSYGEENYKYKINNIGVEMFKEKFYPLNDFMEYREYLKILYNVDIAIFYQYRQQAMGNLIQLLGLGKKVYLNKGTSQWDLFTKLGVKVYDFNEGFDLSIDKDILEKNKVIIKEYFSYENLKKQLNIILYN